ncbi:MAG: peptide chain release factor N(5)-glutamine methyltransferase [Myxococcales bacterium]|nr:peptide chain release factor N(5)-glutamine methyltransferase [Myxococcales bacterium]MCB9520861.1 peptide chain release factor N(5)-glutamine methyltransferase [Myxococcales bacterium]
MWTVKSLIESAADVLQRAGSHSPRLDAERMLADQLGCQRLDLYRDAERPVSEVERDAFRERVRRRRVGEPVAYITGVAGFWTLDLGVDPRVLVPRPETERLVEIALEHTKAYVPSPWRVVDVGTGSGALALALASELPDALVLAIDVSPDALDVARSNAERCGLAGRVRFVCGSVLAPLVTRPGSVDIVVSNPPYVAESDPELEPNVRRFEPELALFGGADGLAVIRRVIAEAALALAPGGLLLVEIGHRQGAAVATIARQHFDAVEIVQDYGRLDRVLVARQRGETAYAKREPRPGSIRRPAESPPPPGPDDGPGPESAPADPRAAALDEAIAQAIPVVDISEL